MATMSLCSQSCFLVLVCAIFVASDGCSTPGCPSRLEAAVIHCSNVQPGSFFMRCLTTHPPGSGIRRNCLNRAGSPQLDICADPKMTDMQVLSCFEKAAADVPWEYCVMSHYLRATRLESAVMECSDEKPGSNFMNCFLFDPWSAHRRHCFNGAGVPQLLFCGDPKKNDEQVLDCFEKAPASRPWENCVIEKFKESKVKCSPPSDAVVVQKLLEKNTTPQWVVGMIDNVKHGTTRDEYDGLHKLRAYLIKCLYPIHSSLPTTSRSASAVCKGLCGIQCGVTGALCATLSAAIPGMVSGCVVLAGGCLAVCNAYFCDEVKRLEEAKSEREKEEIKKCKLRCWISRHKCNNNVYCNGVFRWGTANAEKSCGRTPRYAPYDNAIDQCNKVELACAKGELSSCRNPNHCLHAGNKCRAPACCIGMAKFGVIWGGCNVPC